MKVSLFSLPDGDSMSDVTDNSLLSLFHEKSSGKSKRIRTRALILLLFFLSGFLIFLGIDTYVLLDVYEWLSILLFITAIVALITATMSLIKFYTRNKNKYLFVGLGFVGVGVITSLSAILTTQTIIHERSVGYVLSYFDQSWILSQFLLATFILGSLYISWYDHKHYKNRPFKQEKTRPHVKLLVLILLINTIVLISVPLFYIQGLEILTLILSVICLIGYLRKGLWRWKFFELWFTISLIINIWAQIFFIYSEYDQLYLLSFVLRFISFSFILIGLFMSVYNAFLEVEEVKKKIDIILRSIGESVVVLNATGDVILMNTAGEQISGMTLEDYLGKHYSEVFHIYYEKHPDKKYPDFIERIQKHEKPIEIDRLLLKHQKQETPISVIASTIQSSDGNYVGIVLSIRNITRERELEKSKDNFLSVAAHQLRTPLGAMRWNMEMLLSGDVKPLKPEVKSIIEQIYTNNQRMIGLVNDLLDVSRIDQKRVTDHPEAIEFKGFIDNVFEELKAEAFKKDVKLILEYKLPANSEIEVDKNRLHDVFDNLMSNSIKYNRHGGSVTVTVVDHKPYIQVSIQDTGLGIPKDEHAQIFSKFFRARNARTGVADGSGLGLFVVKSYIDAWGGKISFTSTEGKGSTFVLLIPYKPKSHVLDKSLAAKPHQSD